MSPRTLTIVVDAEGETCGECSHRSSEVWCDIYGPLQDLGEPEGDTLAGRTTGCLEAESLASKALAVVEAARLVTPPSHREWTYAEKALHDAFVNLDAAKAGGA